MASDSVTESLIAEIDKLREAVAKERYQGLSALAHRVYTGVAMLLGEKPPTAQVVSAIYDLLLYKESKSGVPDIVANDGSFLKLREDVSSICSFLLNLANGDLSQQLPAKGYLAGVLKTFQSRLRHLTWQTEMVSRGDFTQRVTFMGEFAASFNLMIDQLDQARREQAESQERYRLLAITDPLTGLPNRRHFFEVAASEFSRAKRYNSTVSVIMMDIDNFKNINDKHGHYVGDLVIQAVADQLKAALRDTDMPGRYGGEEFIALLPETSKPEAKAVAERLREELEARKIVADSNRINVTASFGVSSYDGGVDDYYSIDEVIDDADKALYQAKHLGRNLVVAYG